MLLTTSSSAAGATEEKTPEQGQRLRLGGRLQELDVSWLNRVCRPGHDEAACHYAPDFRMSQPNVGGQ